MDHVRALLHGVDAVALFAGEAAAQQLQGLSVAVGHGEGEGVRPGKAHGIQLLLSGLIGQTLRKAQLGQGGEQVVHRLAALGQLGPVQIPGVLGDLLGNGVAVLVVLTGLKGLGAGGLGEGHRLSVPAELHRLHILLLQGGELLGLAQLQQGAVSLVKEVGGDGVDRLLVSLQHGVVGSVHLIPQENGHGGGALAVGGLALRRHGALGFIQAVGGQVLGLPDDLLGLQALKELGNGVQVRPVQGEGLVPVVGPHRVPVIGEGHLQSVLVKGNVAHVAQLGQVGVLRLLLGLVPALQGKVAPQADHHQDGQHHQGSGLFFHQRRLLLIQMTRPMMRVPTGSTRTKRKLRGPARVMVL